MEWISAEAIVQTINVIIAGAFAVGFYRTDLPRADRDTNDKPKRYGIHLIVFGLLALGGGLLGTLGTAYTVTDALQMKYFSNGSLGFCLFYGCYIALILRGIRVFLKWLARY